MRLRGKKNERRAENIKRETKRRRKKPRMLTEKHL